ncbi:MAG TPA: peroxide stress protein YaaA, partial [Opitutae bacterium]|nr:peroxide stress protein YaaA [Opitutae bacterium]
ISFYAKKARGYMSSFLIRNRIKDIDGLKQFSEKGYNLDPDQSTDSKPVFIRTEENRIAV